MQYAESILDLVGQTPLVRIDRLLRGLGPPDRLPLVLAKLEMLNPGGSVKDRIGLPMIEAAEQAGLLKPGGTIIEPTSGNTGHGLAIAAALKGYRCIFVMADKQSAEKQALLRAYGAEVVLCPTNVPPESPESYYSVAARLARDIPGAFKPDQYWNMENTRAHERTTGPEIWEQTDGRLTHFVASVGTGGTISGAVHFLREKKPGPRRGRRRSRGLRAVRRHRPPVPHRGRRRGLPSGDVRPGDGGSLGAGVGPRRVRHGSPDHARGGDPRRRVVRDRDDRHARSRSRAGRDGRRQRGGDRDPPARRRPQLPVEAVQRRVDARQRAAADDRRDRADLASCCATGSATRRSRTWSSPAPPTGSGPRSTCSSCTGSASCPCPSSPRATS